MSADRSGQRLRRPGSTAATSMELRPAPRDGTAEPAVMAIHRSGMVADAEGTEYPIRPMSILEGEGRAIHDFMVGRGYSQSLETGMAYGVSTLWLADAVARVDGGHHIAIDPRQVSGYHSIGTLNVERAVLDDVVDTYVELSEYRLPKLAGAKTKLDFAFIDGRHLFDSALIDFFYVDRMLEVGGAVALHDLWMPSLRKLAGFIRQNRNYRLVHVDSLSEVGLPRRMYKVAKRVANGSLGRDRSGFRLRAENLCVLEKVGQDDRHHEHFEPF